MSEWIKVQDRLPDFDQKVLVAFTTVLGNAQYTTATLTQVPRSIDRNAVLDSTWYVVVSAGHKLTTVTHWMPIQEIPE